MKSLESMFNEMHNKVNTMLAMQLQLSSVLKQFPIEARNAAVKKVGEELLAKMKDWDEEMIQRKSKAYDDVENFPNKFTAEFIFLINQTESDISRITAPSKERYDELMNEWTGLEATARKIIEQDVPAYNKELWNIGIGAINLK